MLIDVIFIYLVIHISNIFIMNAQHNTNYLIHILLLLIVFILMVIIPYRGFGQTQNQTDFFLVPQNKSDLEPISKNRKGRFLEVTFHDQRLNAIFNSLEVIDYHIAFEDLNCSEYLNKVFIISINGHESTDLFSNLPLIEYVEKIEPPEELNNNSENPYYPNDYIIPISAESQ